MKKILLIIFVLISVIEFTGFSQTSQTYTIQTGNGNATQTSVNSGCFAGTFNNSGTEIGMYSNGSCSGTPQVAHFQTFTTNGVGSGTARPLQVGDEFTVTGYIGNSSSIYSSGGAVGVSFNDNTTYTATSNFNTNQRAYFEILNNGNWYSNPYTSTYPTAGSDATFKIKVTSSNTVNITLNGTTYYDLSMLNAPSSSSKIQSFAFYSFGGGNSNNNYWKNGDLTSSTTVELGNGNGSSTISGVIADGLTATSNSTTATNSVTKSGTGTITLTGANTFTGTTTISGGTLKLNHTGGTTIPATNNCTVNSGTLQISSDQTIANLNLSGGGNLTVDAGVTLTITSTYAGGSGTINNLGTIVLQGSSSQTFPGSSTTINNGTAGTMTNLTINNTNGVTLDKAFTVSGVLAFTSGKLSIGSNTLTLNGTVSGMSATNSFTGSSTSNLTIGSTSSVGTIYFDQTTSADVSTTTGTNALQNLVVSGSNGSVTLGNKLNLFNRLSVSNGTLNTGDVLVLRSISGTSGSNTAYVDQVGGTISGQVTVEKYIHKAARGWRAITAPITYSGISQGYVSGNWQSAFGYSANYGTRITGPDTTTAGNGIDNYSNAASLQTYNSTTGAWTKVLNTNTQTQAGNSGNADNKGFFLFVRGDRTVTPTNGGAGINPNAFVATTLASKGKLQTGTQTFTFTGASGKSWLLGNPYACPVDMSAVTYNNIGNSVYVWDPNKTGSTANTTGGYVTFTIGVWTPTSGSTTQYFQSGQAFFVVPNSATASIVFAEGNKAPSQQNNQVTGTINNLLDIFKVGLFALDANAVANETDGIIAMYGNNFNTGADDYDALKWSTTGIENMSLKRDGSSLSIEARPYITASDSLFLSLTNMNVANYRFVVNPINFDASVTNCVLVDKFLNQGTSISLSTPTTVDFSVTSVSGSNAADRFYFIFNGTGALPTSNALTVKAYKKEQAVVVDWTAIAENNIKSYEIEKSTDGTKFSKLNTTAILAKNGSTTNGYSYTDNSPVNGVNYYRIQSTQNNGTIVYSSIVVVNLSKQNSNSPITVYPNPVRGNSIGLQTNGLAAGTYTVRLYNAVGQVVHTTTLEHNGNNGSTTLQLNNSSVALSSGRYELQLTDSKGKVYHQTVMVVE